MRYPIMKKSALSLMSALLVVQSLWAEDALNPDDKPAPRQYTYSWMFSDVDAMKPRGGTTSGPAVVLDQQVSADFQQLQSTELTRLGRDRQAILAMAGAYRTSFDFIETVGFTPNYESRAPYQSWGTERVYVVADEPEFISLQHSIVMHFATEDGTLSNAVRLVACSLSFSVGFALYGLWSVVEAVCPGRLAARPPAGSVDT